MTEENVQVSFDTDAIVAELGPIFAEHAAEHDRDAASSRAPTPIFDGAVCSRTGGSRGEAR